MEAGAQVGGCQGLYLVLERAGEKSISGPAIAFDLTQGETCSFSLQDSLRLFPTQSRHNRPTEESVPHTPPGRKG